MGGLRSVKFSEFGLELKLATKDDDGILSLTPVNSG